MDCALEVVRAVRTFNILRNLLKQPVRHQQVFEESGQYCTRFGHQVLK